MGCVPNRSERKKLNMKRPLIVLAAGFVLGEVLALQGQKAVSQGLWWWLYAAAGLFGMWSYRMLFPQSGGKRQGSSAGKTALLLFFVLVLTGGCAGYARGAWEKERLDREEVSAREFRHQGHASGKDWENRTGEREFIPCAGGCQGPGGKDR